MQDFIAKKLHLYRQQQGTLSLETIEPQAIFSEGIIVDIKPIIITRARKLIENFMIVANTISAKYSEQHQIPQLRRVVIVPKRWDKIVEIAKARGDNLPSEPNSRALEKFLIKQKETEPSSYPDLSLTIRLFNPPIEGKLVKSKFGVDVGDHVKVKLVHTNIWNGYIDFVAI